MKQVNAIRDYVAKVQKETLDRIKIRLSCLDWPSERDAYQRLDEGYMDHLAALTKHTMTILGAETSEPENPRFDKDHRAATNAAGKLRINGR